MTKSVYAIGTDIGADEYIIIGDKLIQCQFMAEGSFKKSYKSW